MTWLSKITKLLIKEIFVLQVNSFLREETVRPDSNINYIFLVTWTEAI